MEQPTIGRGKGRHKDTRPKQLASSVAPIDVKGKGKPACPAVLQGEAKVEWERMLKLLEKLDILNKADGTALAMYCIQYARWVEAENQLATNGFTQSGQGFLRQSPWVQISNDACKMVKELLKEFGLTPASRAKMAPEPEPKPTQSRVLGFLTNPKSGLKRGDSAAKVGTEDGA